MKKLIKLTRYHCSAFAVILFLLSVISALLNLIKKCFSFMEIKCSSSTVVLTNVPWQKVRNC
jgi:hypothetical protein